MIKKKRLWLSLAPLALMPLIVACSEMKETEFFKNSQGTEITYTTHINFSLLEVQNANQQTIKKDLVVGNFATTDVKTLLEYSFDDDEDSSYFRVSNSDPKRLIYLKKEKFQELIDSGKETLTITTKATLGIRFIQQTTTLKIDTVTDIEKISLYTDENQQKGPAQELNIDQNFNVQVNLEPRERGTVISNSPDNLDRVSLYGFKDNNQDTFYSPIELSDAERRSRSNNDLPSTPDINFESKSEQGTYVSMLEVYFVANGIPASEGSSLFGLTYQDMDGKVERVLNIQDSRVDTDTTSKDPSGYIRGVRYIPIYDTVKAITFSFVGQDNNQIYPFVSEIKIMGKVITDYTQQPGNLLSDHSFASYLLSNEILYSQNNVIMVKNDKVSFNFRPEDLVKLKQIQLFKAPVAFRNQTQPHPVWRIRQGVLSKYKYVVTFSDKTKVGFDIAGTGWPVEVFQLPEKYQEKIVLSVELVSDTLMELKEIVFV